MCETGLRHSKAALLKRVGRSEPAVRSVSLTKKMSTVLLKVTRKKIKEVIVMSRVVVGNTKWHNDLKKTSC